MRKTTSPLRFGLAITAAGLAGLMTGVGLGAPGMVERTATRALNAVEARFGLRLTATETRWSWTGGVELRGVGVYNDLGELLATAADVAIDAEADLLGRSLTLNAVTVRDAAAHLILRQDGTSNLDALLAGLGGSGASRDAAGLPGSRFLRPSVPKIRIDGLRVLIDHPPERLPRGLSLPSRVGLHRGTLRLEPTGDGETPERLADASVMLRVSFSDSSVDPGHGFGLSVSGSVSAGLDAASLTFDRAVRVPIGQRLLAVGGASWAKEGGALRVEGLQLSRPLDAAHPHEVGAALSVKALSVEPLGSLGSPEVLGAGAAGVWQLLRGVRSVRVEGPVAAISVDAAGSTSFDDLLDLFAPVGGASRGPAPERDEPRGTPDPTRGKKGEDGVAAPVAAALSKLDTRLRGLIVRVQDGLGRLNGLPAVEVTDGTMHVDVDDLSLRLDALRAEARVAGSGAELSLEGRLEQPDAETVGAISLSARRDAEGVSISAAAGALGADLVRAVLSRVQGRPDGRVSIGEGGQLSDLALTLSEDAGGWQLDVRGAFRGLSVQVPGLSAAPLEALDGELVDLRLAWRQGSGLLVLDALEARRGPVALKLSAEVTDPFRAPRLRVEASLPEVDVQRVFEAIPPEIVPLLKGLRLRGRLGWELVVKLDTADIDSLELDSRPKLTGFSVESLGDNLDFSRLRDAHAYRILLADGTQGTRFVGPRTGSWVPLDRMSPFLPLALTTTEDGSFYTNDGISTFAIRESIVTNLKRGAFVRGASTLTQQLVKNLYLGGTKELSRKLQELFIAWRLTEYLSKDEIMALYLNTIEFGPGLYGIGDAAYHWFGKRPADLDLTESIFLASIIPSPRRYYAFFEAGAITPRWKGYLEVLLRAMVKRGKITEEELAEAAPWEPIFRGSGASRWGSGADVFDTLPDREPPRANGAPGSLQQILEAEPEGGEDAPWDGDLLPE